MVYDVGIILIPGRSASKTFKQCRKGKESVPMRFPIG